MTHQQMTEPLTFTADEVASAIPRLGIAARLELENVLLRQRLERADGSPPERYRIPDGVVE